jgi:hypothetical protein
MHSPQFRPLPAPTRAEAEFIDCYLEVLGQVRRINPARGSDTYGTLRLLDRERRTWRVTMPPEPTS